MSQDKEIILTENNRNNGYEVSMLTLKNEAWAVTELNLAEWQPDGKGRRYPGTGSDIRLGQSSTVHLGAPPFNLPDGIEIVPDISVCAGKDNRDTIPVKYNKNSTDRALYVISGTTWGNQLSLNKIVPIALQKDFRDCLIADLKVIEGNNVPDGYVKIDIDLNFSVGGAYLYLCYKPHTAGEKYITDLTVVFGKNASPPDGYNKINVDLNKGAGGDYIYLCYKKGENNPITGIGAFVTKDAYKSDTFGGYTIIKADLNRKAGGKFIYFCYKKSN